MADLTKYEKSRFMQSMKCSICGQKIYSSDSFQMAKFRFGRQVAYHWFHTACLRRTEHGKETGEEEIK